MIIKVYEKLVNFIKMYKMVFILLTILFICDNVYLPYYIKAPGGLSNIAEKLEVVGGSKQKGSYNMTYVSEYKVNITMYIYSFFNKDWDLVSMHEENGNESEEDINKRGSIMIDSSISNAIIVAFNKADRYYEIRNIKNYVSYVDQKAQTDLEVGDEIIEIDGIDIHDISTIKDVVKQHEVGDKLTFKVVNDNKEYERQAIVYQENENMYIGISIEVLQEVKTDVEIINNFNGNESGPSGGLLMSLFLYDSLVEDDLTHGLKIAGTGTIDASGNVGAISGVEYKVIGASKNKADVFFIPQENYQEAKQVIEDNNLEIELVGVKTFDDALKYLTNIKLANS